MLRSLYTLEDQTEDEMLKKAIVGVRQDVEAGARRRGRWSVSPTSSIRFTESMLHAGEIGPPGQGARPSHLRLEKLDALRRQVRSAMT